MFKKYWLRAATIDDIGKIGFYSDVSPEEWNNDNFYNHIITTIHLVSWKYIYVIEEMPQIGEPCEFEYGKEIEFFTYHAWQKGLFIYKVKNADEYKVFSKNKDDTYSLPSDRVRKITKSCNYDGKIITDEETGKRYKLSDID